MTKSWDVNKFREKVESVKLCYDHTPETPQDIQKHKAISTCLQILCDCVVEISMVQPLDPFLYAAEFIKKAAMRPNLGREGPLFAQFEYETKKLSLGSMFQEIEYNQKVRNQYIREALDLEEKMLVEDDESVVTKIERECLAKQQTIIQSHYCPEVEELQECTPKQTQALEFLMTYRPGGNIKSAQNIFIRAITDAFLELQRKEYTNPIEYLYGFFIEKSPLNTRAMQDLATIQTNITNLNLKLTQITHLKKEEEAALKLCVSRCESLRVESKAIMAMIKQITVSMITDSTQNELEGQYVFIDNRKKWLSPDNVLNPSGFDEEQESIVMRANRHAMTTEESYLIRVFNFNQKHDASVMIQKRVRGFTKRRWYKRYIVRRYEAACYIQEQYRRRLYKIAISLPTWCQVGKEVIVAQSVARKAATNFKFYEGKDFPTGNYAREDITSMDVFMDRCRRDEKVVAFATDGSLKRFVPRLLSQLETMETKGLSQQMKHGIYIKVIPDKDAFYSISGIILKVPLNRFESARIVFDGTAVEEDVPVSRLTNRWEIRYNPEDDLHYYYDLISSKRRYEEPVLYDDFRKRAIAIQKRKEEYKLKLEEEYQQRLLQSCIRIQSVWRGRKARAQFMYTLSLKEKERERKKLVEDAARRVQEKKNTFLFAFKKKKKTPIVVVSKKQGKGSKR